MKLNYVHIGCFGSIRPLKNHLSQALAAIAFADKHHLKLFFHINSNRVEQKGEQVLKNLQALFAGTNHELIGHDWLNHEDFLKLVSSMHLGMQVSLSETFNIVAADFVDQGVPIVVSDQVDWMPWIFKADPNSIKSIRRRLELAYMLGRWGAIVNSWLLKHNAKKATKVWLEYLRS